MRTSYKTLTNDEYNVLNKISSATRMDVWFFLKQDKYGTDYVWDLEEHRRMSLKTGIQLLTEGIDCKENYESCNLNWFEDITFRTLLNKLGVPFSVSYSGPVFDNMDVKDFVALCKCNGIRFQKSGDDYAVGESIYQFGRDGKCFSVVTPYLAKKLPLIEQIKNAQTQQNYNSAPHAKDKDSTLEL